MKVRIGVPSATPQTQQVHCHVSIRQGKAPMPIESYFLTENKISYIRRRNILHTYQLHVIY